MIEIKRYTSLRLKLLEGCQLRCRFCHHEGNDAAKLVKVDAVLPAVEILRQKLGLDKVHLTGGEPTLYPHLFELIERLAENNFRVAITSHGYFAESIFQHLHAYMAQGCLSAINFSIHTLDPTQYLLINQFSNNDKTLAEAKMALETITSNAIALSQVGQVNINCVVADNRASLDDLFDFAQFYNLPLRLVPDWTRLSAAHQTIKIFLHQRQAKFDRFTVVYPSSNYSVKYSVDNTEIGVKLIRPVGIASICNSCQIKQSCTEFFGNVRLEGNPLQVRLCIHRQGKPYNQSLYEFLAGPQCLELKTILTTPPSISNSISTGLVEPYGILLPNPVHQIYINGSTSKNISQPVSLIV